MGITHDDLDWNVGGSSSKGKWHDINEPGGLLTKPKEEPKPKKRNTGIDDSKESAPEPKPEEVRIISAYEWVEGENGFGFNQKCYLRGTVEFLMLRGTPRRKIEGDTVVETEDGVVENLNAVATGYIDDKGNFELEVTLYFGDHYHDLATENPNAKCKYRVINIRHSTAVNTIDSASLEMPAEPMKLDIEISI